MTVEEEISEELSEETWLSEKAIEKAIEETIMESNEIVETMQEAIEEHRADVEDAVKEANVPSCGQGGARTWADVTDATMADLVADLVADDVRIYRCVRCWQEGGAAEEEEQCKIIVSIPNNARLRETLRASIKQLAGVWQQGRAPANAQERVMQTWLDKLSS